MKVTTMRVLFALAVIAGAMLAQTPSTTSPGAQAPAQQAPGPARSRGGGSVTGIVKDDTGGVIPGAQVTLSNANGTVQTVSTGADGTYSFRGVPPGTYTVAATYAGLQQEGVTTVSVQPGHPGTGNIVMTVQTQRQEVTVSDTATNQVSTDPANNSSQLVLKQEDLDALPDDPDDLQADLEALAGPSAGPGGTQIFIDGFTGGRLPPKASIREIRINSNPFSAEFDKLGFGRIQIFTKPGTDKFHGQGYFNFSDGIWNSRNPFLTVSPPFHTDLFGGNVSGPLGKHASFFIDVERRNIADNGIVVATIPTTDFLGSTSYQTYAPTPQRRTTISPRVDYQLGTNNTLSFRYSYLENDHSVTHLGSFDLPAVNVGNIDLTSNGYGQSTNEQTFQAVETAVLSVHVVNETHFEYDRTMENTTSSSLLPELNVANAFESGGSGYSAVGYPKSYDLQNYYELQNYTSITWGAHTTKFGLRIRTDMLSDNTPASFNGEYSFLGGTFPVLGAGFTPTGATEKLSSIQQYLTTEQLLNAGYTSQQVSALGYGPSKFLIDTGNPYLAFNQLDFGPFVQDDWRVRPNLTISLGVRWEAQTNIHDKNDWAPRAAFAWSPFGAGKGASRPKLVVRGGWGYFYDRFAITNVLEAYRFNGLNETEYTVDNPIVYNAAFSIVPPTSELTAANTEQRYIIDNNLKAPRLMQTVIGIDRQLASRTTLSVNLVDSRGTHELLTDDINAPLPLVGTLPPGALVNANSVGVRPYGNVGDIYDFQSTGIFKQIQASANVNSQVGKWLTLFGRYSYTQAHSNTDGLTTMPADPYDIALDYGRSSLDQHHGLFLGGSIAAPWGLRFSPFIVAHSGTPFNITTGTDLYLAGQAAATARPEPVSGACATCVDTRIGWFDVDPVVGAPLIERNFATGPGFIGLNLRVSKTFGFGTTKFEGPSGGARAGGGGFPGGGGGGGRGGGGGFGGGGGPRGPGESTEHRYNLTISINARNIINHENLNTPNGAITSPYFLESTGITGGFGAEATASNQRRIDLQLRFAF